MLFLRLLLWAGLVMGRRVEMPFPLLLLPLLLSLSWPLCWVGMMEFSARCVVEVGLVEGQCAVKVFRSLDRFVGKTQESSIPISKLNCTRHWPVLHWPARYCTLNIALKHTLHTLKRFLHCSELN